MVTAPALYLYYNKPLNFGDVRMPEGMPPLVGTREAAALSRWIGQRGGIDEAFGALLADPRLPEAIRALILGTEAFPPADTTLDGKLNDVGRYIVAKCALYLHQSGEVTLARLRAIAAVRVYMSAGRTRSLLALLCYHGYLREEQPEDGAAPTRYVPTESFLTAWRRHVRGLLNVAAILEPSVALIRDRLDDPEVFGVFCRHHAEVGFMEVRETHQSTGFVRVFLHRYSGSLILWDLYLADHANGAIPVSINAIAQRHGVSRAHVRRLLDAGVREGLLRHVGDHGVLFEEAGRAAVRFFYAARFFVSITAAKQTMAELAAVR
jgi:hypothetical protein